MKKYAKINEHGALEVLTSIPCISNPTEEMVEAYARENGYKEYTTVPRAGKYYELSYEETETTITDKWIPIELAVAKGMAKDFVQNWLNATLPVRVVVESPSFPNGIIYDSNALVNAMGIEAGDAFIDAKDEIHVLTSENVVEIKTSLKKYRERLYLEATVRRTAIDNAENVDDVERGEHAPLEELAA